MDFLDNVVLPQSSEHIQLLHYMAMLIMFAFLPFISLVFGGTLLSVYYRRKGQKTNDRKLLRFSKEIIEESTFSRYAGFFLGMLPVIALVLIFAQLLHKVDIPTVDYLTVAALLLIAGMILVYVYRYSFVFKDIVSWVTPEKEAEEARDLNIEEGVEEYKTYLSQLNDKSAGWALTLLVVATYFFVAGITLTMYSNQWDDTGLFYIFYSGAVFFRWVYFAVGSVAITGGYILFRWFYWEGGRKVAGDYKELVRNHALVITMSSALALPVLILINIFWLPEISLSASLFGLALVALFLLFLAFHFLYDMTKGSHLKYSGWVFILLLGSSLVLVVAEQSAINQSTEDHSATLDYEFQQHLAELKAAAGGPAEVSGEDIFNNKCAACHRFDVKVVGPPYNETLPKYEGKVDELVGYINNPVKVNPEYPAMPAQGLKPNEARAVAEYLLSTYQGN